MSINKRVVFIGAGNMAEAMISGIVKKGTATPHNIIVTNRSNEDRLLELHNRYGIQGIRMDSLSLDSADVIILAMKPKDAEKSLSFLKYKVRPDQVVMSVLAGITLSFLEENLQHGQQIIRVMPNTSSMIQASATALSAGEYVTVKNMKLAEELMSSIGEVYDIDESQMDLFTGMAGSGPAYYYALMESIEETAAEYGMDRDQARKIGAQTMLGAAKMMLEREEAPGQLRKNITSKNGTTASGLNALAASGGGDVIKAAIEAAMRRSAEISRELETLPVK